MLSTLLAVESEFSIAIYNTTRGKKRCLERKRAVTFTSRASNNARNGLWFLLQFLRCSALVRTWVFGSKHELDVILVPELALGQTYLGGDRHRTDYHPKQANPQGRMTESTSVLMGN